MVKDGRQDNTATVEFFENCVQMFNLPVLGVLVDQRTALRGRQPTEFSSFVSTFKSTYLAWTRP